MSLIENIPVSPITERDLVDAREQERHLAESYLKQVPDLIKWTSTIAVGAILWIANDISGSIGLSLLASIISLVFLVLSLVFAIYIVRRVLTAWAIEWNVASQDYNLCLIKKIKALKVSNSEIIDIEEEQVNRLLSAIKAAKPFTDPDAFSPLVSSHIVLLILGLIGYIVSQIVVIF